MPFFGFRPASASSAAVTAAAGAHHHRQSSLSLSTSKKDARLAEVRAQTRAMAQSGELTLSRSKTSSGHSRSTGSSGHKPTYQNGLYSPRHVVAVEPDNDDSKHRRIDQGIYDASREALAEQHQMRQKLQQQQQGGQVKNQSWWSSALSYANPVVSSSSRPVGPTSNPIGNAGCLDDGEATSQQCKTTASRKFWVP